MGISVERIPNEGMTGGWQTVGEVAYPCEWPQAIVVITIDEGVAFWLSLDKAAEMAEGLRSCLLDG